MPQSVLLLGSRPSRDSGGRGEFMYWSGAGCGEQEVGSKGFSNTARAWATGAAEGAGGGGMIA